MNPCAALWRRTALSVLGVLTTTVMTIAAQPATALPAPAAKSAGSTGSTEGSVGRAFGAAAEEFGVPRDVLVAVGHGETHLDGHRGEPSHANGYGVMHLTSNPRQRTLEQAAALTGASPATLRRDTAANIRGGAAVLRAYADELGLSAAERRDTAEWYEAVARYGGATDRRTSRLYADTVYLFLAEGISARAEGGELVTVRPRAVRPDRGRYADVPAHDTGVSSTDYAPALWVPAHSGNYTVGRSAAITHVVVHVTQGSYAGSISWFQNPASKVSAHYLIRSSDGQVTQTVRDKDTAWHARSGNPYSVGLEHEGYVDNPAWFTDAMYRSSAHLTRHLADRYGIPKDRAHIVGHVEVPGNDHTDPGPNWNWSYYMELVRGVQLSFPSYSTLADGSTGAQVKAAQSLLNAQGHDAGTADGVYGSRTASAVRGFQTARGLPSDGVVGRRTWTALLSAGAAPVLAEGATGAAVERLQRALTAALGRTVAVDGRFGAGTAQAVRDYQTSRGLGADGVVGGATWAALQAGR
ncbi:N-acetylmuramoyl-L-alanine amidase [Streptomyces enissocaesilis]|uniref:N-acetylmuramoyl-L-alanine amidase n=1 Tax=Streptomyces enissocaesilis TaxID=332589 RepID=A0ABP6JS34_9ACTN